jgi:hypothetical protein
MGFTRSDEQRRTILAARNRMAWSSDIDAAAAHIDGDVARAIVAAVFHRHRDQLELLGISDAGHGRQLIGLSDTDGRRNYVLSLDAEAIHVLAETPGDATDEVA